MMTAMARVPDDLLIWDAHAGFELRSLADLDTVAVWKDAGVNFLSVNVGYDVRPWQATVKALSLARDWVRRTEGSRLVGTVQEMARARAAGELAIAFDIEGMNALDGALDMVRFYYELGVRQMLFAYNLNNLAGGGCHDEDPGLSEFGRAVVAEMNAVGMVIDCSHTGHLTTMEAMACSADPVVFSHSNARAARDHERNIRDDQALACAETGGVVGVNLRVLRDLRRTGASGSATSGRSSSTPGRRSISRRRQRVAWTQLSQAPQLPCGCGRSK